MDEKALQRLQRLGIDVWVTQEHADELIRKGLARSRVKSLSHDNKLNSDSVLESRNRVPNFRQSSGSRDAPKRRYQGSNQRQTDQRPNLSTAIDEQNVKPFQINLAVYCHGSSVMVMQLEDRSLLELREDILRTLSHFEEHIMNRLEYRFPAFDPKGVRPEDATLQSAQEGLYGMLSRQSPKVASGTLLTVGEQPAAVAELLKQRMNKFISIDHLPQTAVEKQALWKQLIGLTASS